MTILHHIGDAIRSGLSLIPLSVVRGLFLLTLVVILVWVVSLPRSAGQEKPESSWTADLRIWAAAALLLQIAIYSIF